MTQARWLYLMILLTGSPGLARLQRDSDAGLQLLGYQVDPLRERRIRLSGLSPAAGCDEGIAHPYIVDPRPDGLGLPLLVLHSSIDGFQFDLQHLAQPEEVEWFRNTILARFDGIGQTWLFSGGGFLYRVVAIRDDRWAMGPEGSTFRGVLSRYGDGGPPEIVISGNP